MRIALDGMLLGRRQGTGVETAIGDLAGAFARAGRHDCVLYAPRGLAWDAPARPGFAVRHAPVSGRNRLLRLLWEQAVFPSALRGARADVLHAPGYIAPLRASVPVVLTVYDLIALRRPEFCTRLNAANYRLLLPPSIRRAAAVVVPSEATRGEVEALFPAAAAKVRVVPLGVGREFAAPFSQEELERVRLSRGLPCRYLLFVGRQEAKKNLARLVDAYALLRRRLPGAPALVLAGPQGDASAAVRSRVRRLGLEEHVRCAGYLPRADLAAAYRMAEAFVFPSLCEGFGLPPLEAMSCGAPVACSGIGVLREAAAEAACYFDPLDPASIAAELESLLTDGPRRTALAAAGRARAAGYSWERAAAAVEAVCEDVVTS